MLNLTANAISYKSSGIKVVNNGSVATVSMELTDIEDISMVQLLAVAKNKITGAVEAVSIDTDNLSEGSAALEAVIELSDNAELSYDLIDQNGGSLMNMAPHEIDNYSVASMVNSVKITWNPVTDDMGAVEYIIYRDGVEMTRTNEAEYYICLLYTSELPFNDVSETHWASEYIKSGLGAGVIKGISANEFGLGRPRCV